MDNVFYNTILPYNELQSLNIYIKPETVCMFTCIVSNNHYCVLFNVKDRCAFFIFFIPLRYLFSLHRWHVSDERVSWSFCCHWVTERLTLCRLGSFSLYDLTFSVTCRGHNWLARDTDCEWFSERRGEPHVCCMSQHRPESRAQTHGAVSWVNQNSSDPEMILVYKENVTYNVIMFSKINIS